MDIAVTVNNLSKKYRLYDSPGQRVKEAFNPFRKKYHHDFWALRNISFDVQRGTSLGILGRNGSGKSTLLQLICGILQPSSGSVHVNGRISALLELGSGFNPEFTGRSNAYMYGALMGIHRDEMDGRLQDIEAFADIGDFIDQPMKMYSSGMYVRLAFACAINIKPEILVVDEALSVGDIFFQQKCFEAIRKIVARGTTCLFVSHDTTAIMNLCSQAILLDTGEIDFVGDPESAVGRYFAGRGKRLESTPPASSASGKTPEASPNTDEGFCHELDWIDIKAIMKHNVLSNVTKRQGQGGLLIRSVRVTDEEGQDTTEAGVGEKLNFDLMVSARETVEKPQTGIHILDRLGNIVFASGTTQLRCPLPTLNAGQTIISRFSLTLDLAPGQYSFSVECGEPSDNPNPNIGFIHDRIDGVGAITINKDPFELWGFYGIAKLPMSTKHSGIVAIAEIDRHSVL